MNNVVVGFGMGIGFALGTMLVKWVEFYVMFGR